MPLPPGAVAVGLQMRVTPSEVVVHAKPVGHDGLQKRVQYDESPSIAQMSLRQSTLAPQSSPRPPKSPTQTETAPADMHM